MRVLFISQLFDPENTIKGLNFLKELKKRGYEISVITTFPSYPGGKIYPNYKQSLIDSSIVDGIRIVRLPTFINHSNSAIYRIISYISFGFVVFVYCIFSFFNNKKPDLIYSYYPPVILGVVSLLFKMIYNIPYIYDVQDLWPDSITSLGYIKKNSWLERIIFRACEHIYNNAQIVIVLSNGYKQQLLTLGIAAEKVKVIYNWCDEIRLSKVDNSTKTQCLLSAYFNVLYAGNFGSAQALEYVIEAANILQCRGIDHIRIYLLGDGIEKEKLKRISTKYELSNLIFIDRVVPEKVSMFFEAADALLIHLRSTEVLKITIPQKVQAYLHAGRPIIMAVDGESSSIINKSGAGIVCRACDANELADATIKMSLLERAELANMAQKARSFYWNNMSSHHGINQIDALFRAVENMRHIHDKKRM